MHDVEYLPAACGGRVIEPTGEGSLTEARQKPVVKHNKKNNNSPGLSRPQQFSAVRFISLLQLHKLRGIIGADLLVNILENIYNQKPLFAIFLTSTDSLLSMLMLILTYLETDNYNTR